MGVSLGIPQIVPGIRLMRAKALSESVHSAEIRPRVAVSDFIAVHLW